jgi:hypothetical protein
LFSRAQPATSFDQDDDVTTFSSVGVTGCQGGEFSDLSSLEGCDVILGHLTIKNSAHTDLSVLSKLETIHAVEGIAQPGGNGLTIENNGELLSLEGLHNLRFVEGGISVKNNAKLTSTEGLGATLGHVGKNTFGTSVNIQGNAALTSTGQWNFFEGILAGDLSVTENTVLTQISFNNVNNVGGSVTINANPMLTDVGLQSLSTVGGGIEVNTNTILQTLAGLQISSVGTSSTGTSIAIRGNAALQDISGLSDLQGAITGAIAISGNSNLPNLQGLQKVLSCGVDAQGVSLTIEDNAVLASLDDLSFEGALAGSVSIMRNPSLRTMAGLQAISEIGADQMGDSLKIVSNTVLEQLVGFQGLTGNIPGTVTLAQNPALTDITCFDSVVGMGGLTISNNTALANIDGLSDLKAIVNGALVINNNPALTSLTGLSNMKSITGVNQQGTSLSITNNGALTSISALHHLTLVQGEIDVTGNTALKSVTDLIAGLVTAKQITVNDVQCVSTADTATILAISEASPSLNNPSSVTLCGDKLEAQAGDWTKTSTGSGTGYLCGGSTAEKQEKWEAWTESFGSSGLYMDVDTSECNFNNRQNYIASLTGDSAHWQLVGASSVHKATATSFRVYVWHPALRGNYLKYFATRYNWNLNWVAHTGKAGGTTQEYASGWKQVAGTDNALYLDVNTMRSAYTTEPRYVAALHGTHDHTQVQGIHSLYTPTKNGFRVFGVYPTAITPAEAEHNGWRVAWIGSESRLDSGYSTDDWTAYETNKDTSDKALFISVDTTASKLQGTPAYVTSITGSSHHWMVTGGGSVYDATSTGFKVYLDKAASPADAKKYNWRVNYLAVTESSPCVWSPWSGWGACSKSCGGGTETQQRYIATPAYHGGAPCVGVNHDWRSCNPAACAVDCVMTSWTAYSGCSKTCHTGYMLRTRSIATVPENGGKACEAQSESADCSEGDCPVHCSVSPWSEYGECTKTCVTPGSSTGVQYSTRYIVNAPANNGFTCPDLTKKQQCNTQFCPVNGENTVWGAWGSCDKTCGWGTQLRTRSQHVAPQYGGVLASTVLSMSRPCWADNCPVHCGFSAFGGWSTCTKSCKPNEDAVGTQFATREIWALPGYGGDACPSTKTVQECNAVDCAQDCTVSHWGAYTECTESCNGGTRVQTRNMIFPSKFGGLDCPLMSRTSDCNMHPCPVDCVLSSYGTWSACTQTCNEGTQTATRTATTSPLHGGKPCDALTATRACAPGPCPIDCDVSGWSQWSRCSLSCGTGSQSRSREIISQDEHAGDQCPDLTEDQPCNTEECAVDCVLSSWGGWSTCTKSCMTVDDNALETAHYGDHQHHSRGHQSRHRTIMRAPKFGGKKCGAMDDNQQCNGHVCPRDCVVTDWTGDWTPCSVSCHYGTRSKSRVVKIVPEFGGETCPDLTKTEECNERECAVHCDVSSWTTFGTCSKSCGTGTWTRSRSVTQFNNAYGFLCPPLDETRDCNVHHCPVDCELEAWGAASACSHSCGTEGLQYMTRLVRRPASSGGEACGPLEVAHNCGRVACPVDCELSVWSEWSTCSLTCGVGDMTRTRSEITSESNSGVVCGTTSETETCEMTPCPSHCEVSEFGAWGACSEATCGGGTQIRTRSVITHATHGGYQCPTLSDSQPCNTQCCPVNCVVSAWSGWEDTVAGSSVLTRTRTAETAPSCGGVVGDCANLVETSTWADQCTAGITYGAWSGCTRPCGTGHQYRWREHTVCSKTAIVKYHYKFRQGETCNRQLCTDPADALIVNPIVVPPAPKLSDDTSAIHRSIPAISSP